MKNRIFSLLLALLLCFSIPLTAYAHDVPDTTREDCSIDVVIQYQGEGITDGKLVCIRVGYVDDDGDGNFYFYNVETGAVIEDIQSQTKAQELYDFVLDSDYDFEVYEADSVDSDGTFHFEGLKTGLYLVVQEEAAEGFTLLDPFLVGVPNMVEGSYEYDVTAKVKSELKPEPTTEPPETTKPSDDLPQTGQLNWPVPMLTAGGLLLVAIGWLLRFGKKKETE